VHLTLLNWLGDLGAIDWIRASLDSTSVPAKRGCEATGTNPIYRGKACTKYHLVVDGQGVPLAAMLSATNVHDGKLLEPLVVVSTRWARIGRTNNLATNRQVCLVMAAAI